MHRHLGGLDDVAFSLHAAQWRDEVDYIAALEAVRATLVEGKRMGAVDSSSAAT